MFSLFKKDPLQKELKRAKKVKNRILISVHSGICPDCGNPVRLTTKGILSKEFHYVCTEEECSFEQFYYCDDKGKLLI